MQPNPSSRAVPQTVVVLIVAGFLLRVMLRLGAGADAFLDDSYGFYTKIAETFVKGGGLCVSPGAGCALRPPLYPLLLSPFVALQALYPGAVFLQAAAGAAMAWVAYDLGRMLFTPTAGLWASAATALSPYALVHDTALQETVFVNLFTLLGVWAAIRGVTARRQPMLFVAGLMLGAAVLTTARVAPFVPAAVVWIAWRRQPWRARVRDAAVFAIPVALLVGSWMLRNGRIVGVPVLTTESGASLFYANNEWTFSHFPNDSIDLSAGTAVARLTEERRAALARVAGNAVAEDELARGWAYEYIRAHPADALSGAFRKLWVVVSAQYSPARGVLAGVGYRVLFGIVHVLAAVGLWRARRDGPQHGLTYALLAAFAVTTAMFWAHTSHKSVIDSLLFLYAGATMAVVQERLSVGVQRRAASA